MKTVNQVMMTNDYDMFETIDGNREVNKIHLRRLKESIKEKMRAHTEKRLTSQPYEYPSAGSVFKNPQNDSAGRLIDVLGLKGKTIGGAMISNKHANFIVNKGSAKAKDVYELIKITQERIQSEYCITLEPEIRFIGKFN